MSVCLHLSLRTTFWMDAAGFEPWGGWGTFGSISCACLDHKSSEFLKKVSLDVYVFCFFNATSCCMLIFVGFPCPILSLVSSCLLLCILIFGGYKDWLCLFYGLSLFLQFFSKRIGLGTEHAVFAPTPLFHNNAISCAKVLRLDAPTFSAPTTRSLWCFMGGRHRPRTKQEGCPLCGCKGGRP